MNVGQGEFAQGLVGMVQQVGTTGCDKSNHDSLVGVPDDQPVKGMSDEEEEPRSGESSLEPDMDGQARCVGQFTQLMKRRIVSDHWFGQQRGQPAWRCGRDVPIGCHRPPILKADAVNAVVTHGEMLEPGSLADRHVVLVEPSLCRIEKQLIPRMIGDADARIRTSSEKTACENIDEHSGRDAGEFAVKQEPGQGSPDVDLGPLGLPDFTQPLIGAAGLQVQRESGIVLPGLFEKHERSPEVSNSQAA